jgi:cytidine deaminase
MVLAGGHEIASHTYEHINFYAYNKESRYERIEKELLKSEKIIVKTLGVKPFLVRYPHGYSKPDAVKIAQKNGYYVVNWTFGADWETMSAEKLRAKYIKNIEKGAIFLMHDLAKNEKLLSFLSDFIDEIKARGFEIVTAGQLLNLDSPNISQTYKKKEKVKTGVEKMENKRKKLLKAAEKAADNSYSPYSKFAVGAAALTSKGKIYLGTNVENASYGLSICAERAALFNALANGEKNITALAVWSRQADVFPCGACRQVILELAGQADVIVNGKDGKINAFKVSDLLPNAFSNKDLYK